MEKVARSVSVDKEKWEQFKNKAKEQGSNASDVVNMFIHYFLEGHFKVGIISVRDIQGTTSTYESE